jgi:hypothetical protein
LQPLLFQAGHTEANGVVVVFVAVANQPVPEIWKRVAVETSKRGWRYG